MNHGPVHILLVEDNPADARLIQELFRDTGDLRYTLRRCASVREAETALGDAPAPQVVLLDLSLPDCQGAESFRRMRTRAPDLPLIIMTHLDDEDLAVRLVQEGAQDFLVKGTFDGRLLVRAVRYAIERKRIEAQVAEYGRRLADHAADLERDLLMGREVQEALLPQQYPAFPPGAAADRTALRFAHLYRPCGTVGGDFFAVLPLAPLRAGIFLCDVMGHGIRSALVTALIRGLVQELTDTAGDPALFLTRLNAGLRAILRRPEHLLFVSACHLVLDADTGELLAAAAGHPSPFLLRRARAEVAPLLADGVAGPALGLEEAPCFGTVREQLDNGDALLLFTDGLYEMAGPGWEPFGIPRLRDTVCRHLAQPPAVLLERVFADVRAFAEERPLEDDVCAVLVERGRTSPP